MSLNYTSGPFVFSQSTYADQVALGNAIVAAAVAAGWTLLPGDAGVAGSYRLRSPLSPQGMQLQLWAYNFTGSISELNYLMTFPASGLTTQIQSSPGYFFYPNGGYSRLRYAGGVTYTILATPTMLVILDLANAASADDRFTMVATLNVPGRYAAAVAPNAGFIMSAVRWQGGGSGNTWCNCLASTRNGASWGLMIGNEGFRSDFGSGIGNLQFVTRRSAYIGNDASDAGWRWFDDSVDICEPLLAVGPAANLNPTILTTQSVVGSLYDAALFMTALPMGQTFTYDGKSWINITNNAGGGGGIMRGSLCLRTA